MEINTIEIIESIANKSHTRSQKQISACFKRLPDISKVEHISNYLEYLIHLEQENLIPEKINLLDTFLCEKYRSIPLSALNNNLIKKNATALSNQIEKTKLSTTNNSAFAIIKNYIPTDKTTWHLYLKKLSQLIITQPRITLSDHPYMVRGYSSYYSTVTPHKDDEYSWNEKQRNVVEEIRKTKPKTVLDLGCCTGWYSIKAAENNATVFGLDIDDNSLKILAQTAAQKNLDIYPLKISFDELIKRNAFKKIQNCDMVLCLALLHHLIIVNGIEPATAIKQLAQISTQMLILEFIDLQDKRIQQAAQSPQACTSQEVFHKSLENLAKITPFFTQDYVINELKKYFKSITIKESTPTNTRCLLICKKG